MSEFTVHPPLPPEPSGRRLRQYFVLAVLSVVVVFCAVWGWQSARTNHKATQANAAAADALCKQLIALGQPCSAVAPEATQGAAIVPAVPASPGVLSPLAPGAGSTNGPTNEAGVPQAYAPGDDALIVAVGVERNQLILTFSDGARVAAGPVDATQLSIVLRASPTVSVSPSASPSPSPSPSPITESDRPSLTDSPTDLVSPEENPT